MPPRWPRKPDRKNDPAYRKLDDRMNFALHVAIFAASNSCLWFLHTINSNWASWVGTVTGVWALVLLGHAVFIFAIADYSNKNTVPSTDDTSAGST